MNLQEIAQKAWENLEKDEAFRAEMPEAGFPVFKELTDALTERAGVELWQSPASLESFLTAKIIGIKCCQEGDFVSRLIEALGQSPLLEGGFQISLSLALEELSPIVADAPAFLEAHGMTADAIYLKLGCRPETVARINDGMSLGEFFIENPLVFVKNT